MMKSLALYGLLPPKTAVFEEIGMPGKGGTRATASGRAGLEVLF
jgi:hypothetical protein